MVRFLVALLFIAGMAGAAAQPPAPLAPAKAVYTVTPPIKLTTLSYSPCSTDKQTAPITFSWWDTGASYFTIQVIDGCQPQGTSTFRQALPRSALTFASGVASYTPSVQFAKGLNAAWYVWEGQSSSPTEYTGPIIFVIDPPGVNTYDQTPRNVYLGPGAPCVGRRIVDFSSWRGGQASAGRSIYPPGQWVTIDVSDIVPANTQAIMVCVQGIQGIVKPEPVIGGKSKRKATDPDDPEAYGGGTYTTAARDDPLRWVYLDPVTLTFAFQWNYAFNGTPGCQDVIDPVTGQPACITNTQAYSWTYANMFIK